MLLGSIGGPAHGAYTVKVICGSCYFRLVYFRLKKRLRINRDSLRAKGNVIQAFA
jgi:hypothetical protein